jgi:hypothetical protein
VSSDNGIACAIVSSVAAFTAISITFYCCGRDNYCCITHSEFCVVACAAFRSDNCSNPNAVVSIESVVLLYGERDLYSLNSDRSAKAKLPLLLLILSAATDTGQWYDACRSTQVSITYYFDSTVSELHLFKTALTAAADGQLTATTDSKTRSAPTNWLARAVSLLKVHIPSLLLASSALTVLLLLLLSH